MVDQLAPGLSLGSPDRPRQLLLVSRELLSQVWPQVEPFLLQAEDTWGEYYSLESIKCLLASGKMQLWTMNDEEEFLLAMLTELVVFPRIKVLNLVWVGGSEFKVGRGFLDCVEMWARKLGATKSLCIGREGFLRLLKPYGYTKRAVALEKNIGNMMEH